MKLCLSFIKDLLNAEVIEIENPTDRWDDFDLEYWEPAVPGKRPASSNLVVGDRELLQAADIPVDAAVICAGIAPDIEVERLMAVNMELGELKARVENIFHSFEMFEHRINDVSHSGRPADRLPDLLRQLLAGHQVSEAELHSALRRKSWSVDGPFLCMNIRGSSGGIVSAYHSRLIGGEINGACALEDRDRLVCLVDLSWFDNSADAFMQSNVEFLRDNIFMAGLSNEFRDIMQLPHFRKQAEIALETGSRIRPSYWFHRFSEIVMPYLIMNSMSELDMEYVCAPQLLKLKSHDAANGTEYYQTLRVYLRNNMNVVQTSKELYVHRGTMNYRLKRLEELTGMNLSDPDVRLYLELSYRMMEMKELR